jgi:outer membrane lipoprotein SlyB
MTPVAFQEKTMKNNHFSLGVLAPIVAATALAACGPQDDASTSPDTTRSTATKPPPNVAKPVPRGEVGVITAVVPLESTKPPTGAGAVIGGVVGGVAGHQIGGGDGRKLATVAGAVGGAAVGHQVEKRRNTEVTGYRIDVRLDNGSSTSVTLADAGGYASGQRVRVLNGSLQPA